MDFAHSWQQLWESFTTLIISSFLWQDETEYGWIIYFVGLLRLLGGEAVEHILQLISIPLHWGFTWSSKRKLVTYKWYQNLWPLFVALISCYYQEWTQVFWSPFEKYHPWKWGNCFTWNSFDIIIPSVQDRRLLWRIKTIVFTKISIFTNHAIGCVQLLFWLAQVRTKIFVANLPSEFSRTEDRSWQQVWEKMVSQICA